MAPWTVAGIVAILALISGVGIWSGRKVEDEEDFITGGGRAGPALVCGALMGSLVSSQATMGTVQLAFHYGLAAWWFTLGSGLGCLLLALGYVRPLRASGCVTEMQIISREYGGAVDGLGSVLSAVGIFITVLVQMMACIGLFTLMSPSMPLWAAALVSVAVMACYVLFGGAWGAGMGGVIKVALLYLTSLCGMGIVLVSEGGVSGLMGTLSASFVGTPLGSVQGALGLSDIASAGDISARFLNIVARGLAKDGGSCVSLILGVISTQTYAQAVWSARTDADARRGVLLSALLIPPLGIAGILIGLFMRAHYITQAEVAALTAAGLAVPDLPVLASTLHAMPAFVIDHLPPLLAGAVLGTLAITVVGGGAGLSLGMATILVKDLYKRLTKGVDTPGRELLATRLTIAAILVSVAVLAVALPNRVLNDFGFLSMGLRGAVVFAPLTCALAFRGRIRPAFILASMILGPVGVVVGRSLSVDPLMAGMAVSILCCLAGLCLPRRGGTS